MIIDHIGVAVDNLEASIKFYTENFAASIEHREELPDRNLILLFLSFGNTRLELLYPTGEGTIRKFLNNNGAGLHHICYKVDDIEAELVKFSKLGATLLDQKPRTGAFGSKIAFIHPTSCGGVQTELCAYPK